MRNLVLLIGYTFLTACFHVNAPVAQENIPSGWRKVDAEGYFTFRLPKSMELVSREQCPECAWGSTFSDDRIRLHATYTDWNEEYALQFLAKQKEYVKELTEIDGKSAKIQSWRLEDAPHGFRYAAEVRFYSTNRKLIAKLSGVCKERRDVETAKRIFKSVDFPK